jgi:bifunctional non-homologous end joining protein LigD
MAAPARKKKAAVTAGARPSRDYHPAKRSSTKAAGVVGSVSIPREAEDVVLDVEGRKVKLTNLGKLFWPQAGITKGDLLQYYADIAGALLPHVRERAMVMKRYPNGADGEFFFMKRAPQGRPEWIETCSIEHASGNVIDFPIVNDVASLLWVVNLGCIDLNQWYARCDDVDRPDYLHFDLDPGDGVPFTQVLEVAQLVNETLQRLQLPTLVKTSGSKGIHVYVPIVRGPTQKQVWEVSKAIANDLAKRHPALMTAVYKREARPPGRVLVDYNQNAWGRTLASVYSVRPRPRASVSTPVTWAEIARGLAIEDFRIDNVPARVRAMGDLWAPLNEPAGRVDLTPLFTPPRSPRPRSGSQGGRARPPE